MRKNTVWAVVLISFAGLGGCSTGDSPGPGEVAAVPRVTGGMSIADATGGLYVPSPDGGRAVTFEGDSWCIADLPNPDAVADVLPVTMGALSPGTSAVRCSDSPVVTSPLWSPGGSRIVALGQESTPQLYVLDPLSLEIETILDNAGRPAVWVSESELLYFRAEPEPTWHLAPIDDGEPRTISAPRPAPSVPVLVDDSRVVYRTDRPRVVANPGDAEVADLTQLDWTAGTTKELAALRNLNPDGQIADPGTLTDMTPDLRYAALWAQTKANESREGPTVYVYDLESGMLMPHTPPGLVPQPQGGRPYLVGEEWIIYSAWIDDVSGKSEPHISVYLAPLDDPSGAIELFRDGLLIDVHNDRLTIGTPSGGVAILDMDF